MIDRMDKAVIVINFIGRKGGGTLDAYKMAEALVKRGVKVVPIIPVSIENKRLWDNLHCYKIIYLDSYDSIFTLLTKSMLFGKYKKTIKKELADDSIDFVYSPMVGFWTEKINKIFPDTKKIIACHDPFPHSGKSRIYYYLFNRMFTSADVVIVHTKKFVEYLISKYSDVRYIPLGPHNMYKVAEDKTNIVEYDPRCVNFLFFGRIDKYKGIDILLEAYKMIESKHRENISLTIIGNGDFSEYQDEFDKLSNARLINRWIQDGEIESVFSGANIITVCPYRDATQSGVVLLSYDYGCPVIASKVGGLDEQLVDGETGYLIEDCNSDRLSKVMERFVLNPKRIDKMKKGIEKYMAGISWDQSAEMLINIAHSGE